MTGPLIPFDAREAISIRTAAEIVRKSESTIRNWVREHSIGRRIAGGETGISRPALAMLVDDDHRALSAYLGGDRTSETVARYFRRFGLADVLAKFDREQAKSAKPTNSAEPR